MKILPIVLLLTIVLAQDCKNRKNTETLPEMNTTEVMPVIKMMKNACFGKCPMYAITFYNDGKVEYVGRANVDKMGTFTKQIPTEKVALLLQGFHNANFWEMDEKYLSQLSDSQKTIITLFRKDTSKTVTGDHDRPAELIALENKLIKIADSTEGWTKIKEHPNAETALPDYFIKNEILVKFKEGTDVEAVVATKKSRGLAIQKRIAPNADIWVLTYDTIQVQPTMMLREVKRMPGVLEASFNKQLKPREH